jgi:ATP-dependent RNA helicase DDX42
MIVHVSHQGQSGKG